METKNRLTLKWGTLKSWRFDNEKGKELLKEYNGIGSSYSAMAQKDTTRQKEIICELIDLCDGDTIYLGRDGKPILRPLSDLTKEIEHNGEKFVPIEIFEIGDDGGYEFDFGGGNVKVIKNLETIAKYCIENDLNYIAYKVVQELISWHFDVFGLIEKGLAVDLNTIKGE